MCDVPVTGMSTDDTEERGSIDSSEDPCDVEVKTNSRTQSPRSNKRRMKQNFIIVWLDDSIEEADNENCRSIIDELQQVLGTVDVFADADECVDFIADVKDESIFFILSKTFVQTVVPVINEIAEVTAIYVFSDDKTPYEGWVEQWGKLKGVFNGIEFISKELQRAVRKCNQNSVSTSFIPANFEPGNQNLGQLGPSFMYTLLLIEMLLTIDFEQKHLDEFFMYCRELLTDNFNELHNVDKMEKEYHHRPPIWWYTTESFLYRMVNRALRLMDVDIIVRMGFFCRDLHNDIAALHKQQHDEDHLSNSFAVYRSQCLSAQDFDQLSGAQGGLLSFNNFLSTTQSRKVADIFAGGDSTNLDVMGVLFVMKIDPSISRTPFADIREVTYFKEEDEILFSMHSVFRIGQIEQIDGNSRLWQVDLTLTSDTDPQLHALTEYIRREICPHQTGWYRLGSFLLKMGEFKKAEEVFESILEQTHDESEKANIYHMLGITKYESGDNPESIKFYEMSIEIMQKSFRPSHPDWAASYRHIAVVYDKMGEHSKAFAYHGKALQTYQETDSSNHFTFSTSQNNGDSTNQTTDYCTIATSSFQAGMKMLEQTVPYNDLSLSAFCDLYGSLCEKMGNNEQALAFYDRAIKIKKQHLPPNHPSLAVSYSHYGTAYEKLQNSSIVPSFSHRALNVPNHMLTYADTNPRLVEVDTENNDSSHQAVDGPLIARRCHRLALHIARRSLPANHPDLEGYRQRAHNEEPES